MYIVRLLYLLIIYASCYFTLSPRDICDCWKYRSKVRSSTGGSAGKCTCRETVGSRPLILFRSLSEGIAAGKMGMQFFSGVLIFSLKVRFFYSFVIIIFFYLLLKDVLFSTVGNWLKERK